MGVEDNRKLGEWGLEVLGLVCLGVFREFDGFVFGVRLGIRVFIVLWSRGVAWLGGFF